MPYANKEDQAAASRRHYEANREKMKARAAEHRKSTRLAIRSIIKEAKSVPCCDCKRSYPSYVMDFDHRGDKLFNIGNFSRERIYTLEKVRAEIAKCDVVCANCHRERTHVGSNPTSATT